MTKLQELEMWYALALKLSDIPDQYRSRNHTAFFEEVKVNVLELVEKLGRDPDNWKI